MHVRVEASMVDDGVARVAGRKKHRQIGVLLGDLFGQCAPAKAARKNDVGEQEIDFRAVLDVLESARGVGGLVDLVPQLPQRRARIVEF